MMKVLAEIPARHLLGKINRPLVRVADINFCKEDEVVIQIPIKLAHAKGDNFFIVNLGEGFPENLVISRDSVKRFVLVPE